MCIVTYSRTWKICYQTSVIIRTTQCHKPTLTLKSFRFPRDNVRVCGDMALQEVCLSEQRLTFWRLSMSMRHENVKSLKTEGTRSERRSRFMLMCCRPFISAYCVTVFMLVALLQCICFSDINQPSKPTQRGNRQEKWVWAVGCIYVRCYQRTKYSTMQRAISHYVLCCRSGMLCHCVHILCVTGVRSRSQSLSFEGDSDSGPYLSHLDFCVILLQSIWLSCNLFYN